MRHSDSQTPRHSDSQRIDIDARRPSRDERLLANIDVDRQPAAGHMVVFLPTHPNPMAFGDGTTDPDGKIYLEFLAHMSKFLSDRELERYKRCRWPR